MSWDVAMSGDGPGLARRVKQGDILSTSATYDTSKASWYEVMGIMVVGITDGPDGGVDPFTGHVDQTDYLTHGRLPENIEPRRRQSESGLHNPIRLRQGPFTSKGHDPQLPLHAGRPVAAAAAGAAAVGAPGALLTFVNEDNPLTVRFHTITACKAPCTGSGGIRYPLAGAGPCSTPAQLGYGPTISTHRRSTPTGTRDAVDTRGRRPRAKANAQRRRPDGPRQSLIGRVHRHDDVEDAEEPDAGTYTYFCRIHPFMRGAFRVVPKQRVEG